MRILQFFIVFPILLAFSNAIAEIHIKDYVKLNQAKYLLDDIAAESETTFEKNNALVKIMVNFQKRKISRKRGLKKIDHIKSLVSRELKKTERGCIKATDT